MTTVSININELAKEAREAMERDLQQQMERMETRLQGLALLHGAGVIAKVDRWDIRYGGSHEVKQEDLKKVYQAIGRLRVVSKSAVHDDARKRDIDVYLESVHYPGIQVRYRTKLPKGKKMKCKLVTTVSKSTHLVCTSD